ncbi:CDP-alcohol phosphatidyltransferase family protein [Candidatus Shapirobacteria bacterium]|nr:CDP-alcohol phosphatidyltransferase family protein [Candidatus Shapirobacteria bacterium]
MINLLDIHQKKMEVFEKTGIGNWCDWLEKRTWIRPNHITVVNLMVGWAATMSLFNDVGQTSGLIILMMMLDGFDGYYAVRNNLKTKMGEVLDHGGGYMAIGVAMLLKSYWHYGEWWIEY